MRKEYLRVARGSFRSDAEERIERLSLQIYRGEIASILPMDSGGIRTLKAFLTGRCFLESGGLYLRGRAINARELAQRLQKEAILIDDTPNLIETLSLAGNLFGTGLLPLLVNRPAELEKLRKLTEVFAVDLPESLPVSKLTLLQRCQAEVLKGVLDGKQCFLLDLRHLSLALPDCRDLLRLTGLLRDRGRTVILMDYRPELLVSVSDTITVMRNAGTVWMLEQGPFSAEVLERRLHQVTEDPLPESAENDQEVLRLKQVSGTLLEGCSLSVKRGEVVSVIYQSRQEADELCGILTGGESFEGKYALCGVRMQHGRFDRMTAVDSGLCVIDAVDFEEQIFRNLNLYENICMARGRRVTALWRRPKYKHHMQREIDRAFGEAGSWKRKAGVCTLEEQWRAILLRWLLFRPALVLLRDPFLGMSEAARELTEYYLGEFLRHGTAVIVLSEQRWERETAGHRTYLLDGTLRKLAEIS